MENVIDFHVHPYLSQTECLGMYRESFYLDPMEARRDLEESGIMHICGSVIENGTYTSDRGFEYFRELNRKALKLQEIYGGFYTPGIHVHPDYVKESCDEIEYMHGRGVRLIGELVPYSHGWNDYSCRGLAEILDTAEQYGMIVSYHTMGEDRQIEDMIAEHAGIIFVAAHPGQKGDFLKHIDRMKRYENAWLDLSGTGLFRYGMLVHGVNEAGFERFLFGTDYPICNPRMYVQAVLQEHISDEAKECILWGNARRLLE